MLWGRKEPIKYIELFPKLDYEKNFSIINSLGHIFELVYHRDKDVLHMYAQTNIQLEVLRKDFGVKEGVEIPTPRFLGKVIFWNDKDFYWGAEFNDFSSFLTKLQPGEQLRVWVVLEPRLNDVFIRYSDKLKRKKNPIGARQRELLASRLEQHAKNNVYYIQPYLLSDDKKRVKELFKELHKFILTRSGRMTLKVYKTKNWRDVTPRVPVLHIFKYKRWLWTDEDKVGKIAVIPNPSMIPIQFASGGLLPEIPPDRKGFRIGQLAFSGKEVRLELADFERHAYVIGGTGAGKTSTLRILLKRLRETYPNIIQLILDPHGDFAEEMLSFYANYHNNFDPEKQLFYFHPIEAPITVNPIALPRLPNVEQAVLLGFSNVMEVFERLFMLKEGAVYVKYIIQNALQLLYQKTPEPTFRDLYSVIIGLRNGTLDLPINNKDWEEKLALFQDLEDTTFVSALSRIEMLATNPLLQKIFSKNTIDDNVLFAPGNVIIINASKGAVGDQVSFVIMAGWLFKVWYYVLARAQLGMERIPVIVPIDEFQNVAELSLIDTILAEARKYGLHLILAHQHTGQIDMNLLKSLMSNTGVKVLMRMQGSDAEKFAEIFPEFKSELVKTLPAQSVGQATLILTPRKPEDKAVPIRVNIDWEDFKKDKDAITRVVKRMEQFTAKEEGKEKDVTALLNPVLKYCEEKPDVLGKLVLYHVFKGTCDTGKHCIALVDLVRELGVDRDKVEEAVDKLDAHGYLTVEKVKGKKVITYGKGLFPLKGIVRNEEGKKVAMKVIMRLYKEGYVVVPGKQEGDVRPDFVAFPYDRATLRPKYDEAIAVEIESPNELTVHQEQVKRNMLKYMNLGVFKEVRVYTSEDEFHKLKKVYEEFLADNTVPEDYKKRVKIFPVKIVKESGEEEGGEEKEGQEETTPVAQGQSTTQESVSTPQLIPTNGTQTQTNGNNSLSVAFGNVEIRIVGDKGSHYVIEINGNKFLINKADFNDFLSRKSEIKTVTLVKDVIGFKLTGLLADGGVLTAIVRQT